MVGINLAGLRPNTLGRYPTNQLRYFLSPAPPSWFWVMGNRKES